MNACADAEDAIVNISITSKSPSSPPPSASSLIVYKMKLSDQFIKLSAHEQSTYLRDKKKTKWIIQFSKKTKLNEDIIDYEEIFMSLKLEVIRGIFRIIKLVPN